LLLAACSALTLTAPLPLLAATATITALSAGFDLSHPLFSGMISALDPVRTAQAMALNTFGVFVGFGLGSMIFGALYAAMGMTFALTVFACFQLTLAVLSLRLLRPTWR
jgi:predicted MFS family arabinose efflux permease